MLRTSTKIYEMKIFSFLMNCCEVQSDTPNLYRNLKKSAHLKAKRGRQSNLFYNAKLSKANTGSQSWMPNLRKSCTKVKRYKEGAKINFSHIFLWCCAFLNLATIFVILNLLFIVFNFNFCQLRFLRCYKNEGIL